MTRNYREHLIDAQPDHRVGIWRKGRKLANIRYADTHRWRAEPTLEDVRNEDPDLPSQQDNNLGGVGFRRNEFEQLQEAIDAVIDRQPATEPDEASRQIDEFFHAR